MRIKEWETFHSKLVISYTLRFPLWEAPIGSRLKKSWLQNMLDKIVDRKGEDAYQLELPPQLSNVHDVFHVSLLKKCLWVPEEQLPMEELDLGGDPTYSERPIKILDTAEWVTRSKVIKTCKVQRSHHTKDESTWEHEEELRADYLELFLSTSWISRVRFL
jgi:hypothetical protein